MPRYFPDPEQYRDPPSGDDAPSPTPPVSPAAEPPLTAILVPDPPPQRRRWLGRLIALAAVLLVLGPIAVVEFPREVARWHAASALEAQLNGDLPAALARLERALAWNPSSSRMLRQRSQWRLEAGDLAGALEDAQRAVDLAPNDVASWLQQAEVRQHQGRFALAVRDWDRIVDLAGERSHVAYHQLEAVYHTDVYNGRAYARALAGIELEAGLEDVQRALQSEPHSPMYLDTRGMLYYQLDRLDDARSDLDQAVSAIEQLYSFWENQTRPTAQREQLVPSQNEPRFNEIDPRKLRQQQQLIAESTAVIHYHRGLVLEALGDSQAAQEDYQRVRELGFEPDPGLF